MKVNILAKICFPFSKNCGKRLQELRNCRPSFLLRPHRQKQNTWPKLGILERWSDQHAHRPPWSELINSFHRMVPRFATAGSLQRLMIFFFNASFRSPSPPHPPFRLLYNWDGSFSACRVLPRLSWCLPLFTCYRWLSKNRFATPDVKKKTNPNGLSWTNSTILFLCWSFVPKRFYIWFCWRFIWLFFHRYWHTRPALIRFLAAWIETIK